jgi:hypothetical protein
MVDNSATTSTGWVEGAVVGTDPSTLVGADADARIGFSTAATGGWLPAGLPLQPLRKSGAAVAVQNITAENVRQERVTAECFNNGNLLVGKTGGREDIKVTPIPVKKIAGKPASNWVQFGFFARICVFLDLRYPIV